MDTNRPGLRETARYKVFLNKGEKNVLVLRFPDVTKDRPFNDTTQSKPLALRIKPKSRLVEVDVPLPDKNHIDRRRAVELGQGARRLEETHKGTPVGIAGGFSQGTPAAKPERTESKNHDDLLRDFDSAMEEGDALNKITYSGMIKPFSSTDPTYYLGNFLNGELHLTKVSAFCTLGVGLQHLDAIDLSEKTARRAEKDDEDEKATAVNVQVQTGEERVTDESIWKKMLNDVSVEKWQELEWVDEGTNESFALWEEAMFLDESLRPNQLLATMSRAQYLDALSAPRVDPALQARRIRADGSLAEDGDMDLTDASDQEEETQVMTDVRG